MSVRNVVHEKDGGRCCGANNRATRATRQSEASDKSGGHYRRKARVENLAQIGMMLSAPKNQRRIPSAGKGTSSRRVSERDEFFRRNKMPRAECRACLESQLPFPEEALQCRLALSGKCPFHCKAHPDLSGAKSRLPGRKFSSGQSKKSNAKKQEKRKESL